NGTFERITTAPQVQLDTYATGAAWVDYDNDGRLDLFVTRIANSDTGLGPNTLYHNEGHGRFTSITIGPRSLHSHAGLWADFDNDGFVDLFVVSFGRGASNTLAPDNYLYHNNRDGTFLPMSFGAKPMGNGDSFDVAAADFNNDGWVDLLVPQGAV